MDFHTNENFDTTADEAPVRKLVRGSNGRFVRNQGHLSDMERRTEYPAAHDWSKGPVLGTPIAPPAAPEGHLDNRLGAYGCPSCEVWRG